MATPYANFKEAVAILHPDAIRPYVQDGTGLSADEAAALQRRFPKLYQEYSAAGKTGGSISASILANFRPAPAPAAAPAPAPTPAPAPAPTPAPAVTYDPTRQTVVPVSEARVSTGPATAPQGNVVTNAQASAPAAVVATPVSPTAATADASAAVQRAASATPQLYQNFKEAVANLYPDAIRGYISDGTGIDPAEAVTLQQRFPKLYQQYVAANRTGGSIAPETLAGLRGPTPAVPGVTPGGGATAVQLPQPATGAETGAGTGTGTSTGTTWFDEWLKDQEESAAKSKEEYEKTIAGLNAKIEEQGKKNYESALLLTGDQIAAIDEAKARNLQNLTDAQARYGAASGEARQSASSAFSNIVRDYAQQRGGGLLNLAARNRGIDPSASGRFLNQMQAQKGSALAGTQQSLYGTLRGLREALDLQERETVASNANLNRLSTRLGTNLTNLFPGVSF